MYLRWNDGNNFGNSYRTLGTAGKYILNNNEDKTEHNEPKSLFHFSKKNDHENYLDNINFFDNADWVSF